MKHRTKNHCNFLGKKEQYTCLPHGHGPRLYEVLEAEVVNALGREHYRSPGAEDLLDPLLGDVHLPLSDSVYLLHVVHHHLWVDRYTRIR